MPFRLSTALLLILVLGSSLVVFGGWVGAIAFLFLTAATTFVTWPSCLVALLVFLPFVTVLLLAATRFTKPPTVCIATMPNTDPHGLLQYHQANSCFPPAYVADKRQADA